MRTYFAEWAWLPFGCTADVRLTVDAGRFVEVRGGSAPQLGDVRLPGLVLPGLANTHSHAFHRALRGRTHQGGRTFWTWRHAMFEVAGRLEPDSYLRLARAVYAEMALAGITCVGEFHYVHHNPDGRPYADPNAMAVALVQAARDAGIRLTLLDACYLAGGLGSDGHLALLPTQERFSDGDATRWAERVARLHDGAGVRIGAAIHSVRAVPAEEIPRIVAASAGRPLHVHVSETSAENAQCEAFYGRTPTRLLDEAGALGPQTTAVHATHLTEADLADLGSSGVGVSFCPTTERDLADGICPARQLHDAGAIVSLGTDQNAVIDLLEEARALEMHERLTSHERGRFTPEELVGLLSANGHRSLGWADAGRLEVGYRADLVAVRLDTVRTTAAIPEQAVLTATAADVDTVLVDGRVIVSAGRHVGIDVPSALAAAIAPLWP